jgi:membrane-associated phospholipid phosphatase
LDIESTAVLVDDHEESLAVADPTEPAGNSLESTRPLDNLYVAGGHAWQFDGPLTKVPTTLGDDFAIPSPRPTSLASRVWSDHLNFYSPESLTLLGGGLIVGAALANTSTDAQIQKHFQSSVRGASSDDWFEGLHGSKELGNGKYTLPVFATSWAMGELLPNSKAAEVGGRWGERSLRGFLVGAPPLLAFQQLTGGSRPTEISEGSEWHPLHDNNGISGHSFMGSLPFITAAKMTDNRGLKLIYYAGSTLAPLSRVNDNAHYPSQVALGWWMAYLAASAIDATDDPNSRWHFSTYSTTAGPGILAEFSY